MLPIAMLTGASIYLLYYAIKPLHVAGPFLSNTVAVIQPLLLFIMLFLTFCRIEPKDLKPHRWHWWLLLIQGGLFTALGFLAVWLMKTFPAESHSWIVLIECAMICLISPTATAAAVVTRKLGGDVAGITTYIVLINLLVAVLVPLIVPLIQPVQGMDFWTAFLMIIAKVFPLLMFPCLLAWLVRYMAPKFHQWLMGFPDLAFYIWAIALTLAIAVTTRAIVRSDISVTLILLMGLVSLLCCAFQFAMGRYVGKCYKPRRPSAVVKHPTESTATGLHARVIAHSAAESPACIATRTAAESRIAARSAAEARARELRKITAGQSLGQKNTVFSIWMAYTFMTPETAIVGGLYSLWHNAFNSWQLYRHSHRS